MKILKDCLEKMVISGACLVLRALFIAPFTLLICGSIYNLTDLKIDFLSLAVLLSSITTVINILLDRE